MAEATVVPADDDEFWQRERSKLRQYAESRRSAPKRPSFAAHALDSRWTGLRSLGGVAWSGDLLTHVELTHFNSLWDPGSPQIRVATRIPDRIGTLDGAWGMLASDQVEAFWEHTGRLDDNVRRAAFPLEYTAADPTAPWADAQLAIDGEPVDFRVLAEGDVWVAQARRDEVVVGIDAVGWPMTKTGLVTVHDLSEYEEGSAEYRGRWRDTLGG